MTQVREQARCYYLHPYRSRRRRRRGFQQYTIVDRSK